MQSMVHVSTFVAIVETEFSDGANLIAARYILFIKLDEGKKERHEARYVACGHLDITKDCLVHGTQTIQFISVCLVLVVEEIKGFRI